MMCIFLLTLYIFVFRIITTVVLPTTVLFRNLTSIIDKGLPYCFYIGGGEGVIKLKKEDLNDLVENHGLSNSIIY